MKSNAETGGRECGHSRKRSIIRKSCRWVAIGAVGLGLLGLAGWLALHLVPLPPALFAARPSDRTFLDRNGKPLRIVRPGENLPFGHPIDYANIPRPLIEATLAAEDRRFWSHCGVDWQASLRAMWQAVRYRRVISGGSTITQQLIKLAEPRPRTLRTKCIEALQAMRLEQIWSKQRTLSAYLNRLDYGNFNRGADSAARYFFNKPPADLSPAECAFLAALPQAPSRLNPYTHFDRAQKRQQWLLTRMRAAGWLTEPELSRALHETIRLAKPHRVFEASHFVDLLLASLGDGPEDQAAAAGIPSPLPPANPSQSTLRTTVDLDLNRFVENTLHQQLLTLHARHVYNGAAVILDNATGGILSLVGSDDYFSPRAGQVNAAWSLRSPGSTFKPFTYLLALQHGDTPATMVADVPTEFATATGLFAPVNYNRHCYGPMRYRLALANSLNISAVKVLASIGGPEPLQHLLQQCGLSTLSRPPEQYGLGLTIGNAEARLLELANAYACLARLGQYKPYRLMTPAQGAPSPGNSRQVADASAAYLIADILSDNEARALAFDAESSLRFDFPVACKTGTSSSFRDNWAFGYTPEFTAGVWIGNADGSPMENVSGVTGAAPILHEIFEHLHQRYGTTWYSQPADVVECQIHPITGKRLAKLAPAEASGGIKEKFLARNLPPLESADDYQMKPDGIRAVRLGSEFREWFATGDNWLDNRAVVTGSAGSLRILFPPPGTTIYLDADLPDHGRRMDLRASGSDLLVWQSATLKLVAAGNREVAILSEGRHEITVRDSASGNEASTWIEVRVR
ncbi:MAG: transglycosylase domain-containing protein [Verrucomicrobiota bacterium]